MNNKKIKRIGIDARFYGPLGKGLGRYTKEVTDGVIGLDRENEYIIFLSKENFEEFKTDNRKVKKVLANPRWYTLAEQIMMPYLIWKEKLDLIHFPHFNVPLVCPAKLIVTIHDLILTKHPTQRASTLSPFLYKIKNIAYKIVIKSAIKRAKKIIAVSNFTRDDIINQFRVNKDKIIVTYEGIAKDLSSNLNNKNILNNYNIKTPYLLYVGNAYPHKNLEGLIRVFSKIKEKQNNLSLVLVGKEDYFYKRVKDYATSFKDIRNNIIFPGYIPDKDLSGVFRQASVYVFPSLYEGFGLPPLEAMTQGCPVASSNKTSMPELLGDAALYFNPEDEQDMKNKILEIINNNSLREELIKKGREQVKKYSWEDCAEKTLRIYNEII